MAIIILFTITMEYIDSLPNIDLIVDIFIKHQGPDSQKDTIHFILKLL